MRCNAIGLLSVVAFLDHEARRRLAGAMIFRRFLPRVGANFQSIQKLAKIVAVKIDVIDFLHGSADIPGQIRQAFSCFNFTNKSGRLAVWQKPRL
jgi:hypothetical protein